MSWRPARLRNCFDEGRRPTVQGRPTTHHRDYYLATDGSVDGEGGRVGAVAETIDGVRVGTWSRPAPVVDNNDAELKALHWGLDLLAARAPPSAHLGILLDHDPLAEQLARVIGLGPHAARRVPIRTSSPHHWRGILARIHRYDAVGVAAVGATDNPAHEMANGSVHTRPGSEGDRCVRATGRRPFDVRGSR